MRVTMKYGQKQVDVEVDASRVIAGVTPPESAVDDPAAAVQAALDEPFDYPPLRRALTPDDQVTVVVDEQLPNPGQLLVPVLEHLTEAGIAAEAVTILVPPSTTGQPWVNDLPDAFQEARVEVHDPANRKSLRYLATTRGGRRLYLNQRIVDADQIVVLAGRHYDPVHGYSGAEGAIFPALSDVETREEVGGHGQLALPEAELWPAAQEATEASWLLGAPFFVQVIEGSGDGVAAVIGGSTEASDEGRRQVELRWSHEVAAAADIVVASISGDPARRTFDDLAAAAACAARVVRSGGRIVLLSEIATPPGPEFDRLRGVDDPGEVASELGAAPKLEQLAVARWAGAAAHARLTVLSGLDSETLEELSATPLESPGQVQRLLDAGGTCLFLEDAHKAVAILADD
jgi:nickel-dependent lactate racemase